jgi:cell division transport system permease protein
VSPRFFLAEALRSIRGNAAISVAATVTVLIAVFILGAFIPAFLYVQSTVDSQKERLDVDIYIADAATVEQVNGLRDQIEALQSQGLVQEFRYVSKEDGLAELRERLKDPSILEELSSNPLPAKFNAKPTDPERNDEIAASLQDHPAIDPGLSISYSKETTDKLLRAARIIQWAGLVMIVILLIASILLIGNTIRLSIFARRREVEVMKLVGATNWFIRWPFVIEGIICGLIGAALSVGLLWAAKVGVVDQWIESASSELVREDATTIGFPLLSLILIASGAVVGALGSGITLRRFLKV